MGDAWMHAELMPGMAQVCQAHLPNEGNTAAADIVGEGVKL